MFEVAAKTAGYDGARGGGLAMCHGAPVPGSGESSVELLERARRGDATALNRLCTRYRPSMVRWASGRLPHWARDVIDTNDLVQDALLRTLTHIERFEPRHDGALRAYLRQAVLNRIHDQIRRVRRQPALSEMRDDEQHRGPSPLEEAVGSEVLERYEAALTRLRPEDREAIVARVELGLEYAQVAESLGKPSVEAAQMAVSRALVRLAWEMGHER